MHVRHSKMAGAKGKLNKRRWDGMREKEIVNSMHGVDSPTPTPSFCICFMSHSSSLLVVSFFLLPCLPQVHAVERFVVCDEGGVEGVPWGGRYDVQRRGAQVRDERERKKEGVILLCSA